MPKYVRCEGLTLLVDGSTQMWLCRVIEDGQLVRAFVSPVAHIRVSLLILDVRTCGTGLGFY